MKIRLKADLKILITGLVIAAVGLGVYVEKTARYNQYNWITVEVPVQLTAGFVTSASFTTQLDQDYEIEIAVLQDKAEEEHIEMLILTKADPSPLDIDWVVKHNNSPVAQGKSHDYIYINRTQYTPSSSIMKKIGFAVVSEEIHQGDTVARGVGKFSGIKGELFQIEARVGKAFVELANAAPVLRVRINRKFALRFYRDITASAKLSKALLGLSFIMIGWYLLTLIWNKFHSK